MKWLLLVQVMAEHTQCGHSGSNGVMKSITEVYTHTVRTFRVKWSDEVYHWGVHPHSADIQGDGVMKSITEVYTHTVRTFRVMEWWSLSLRCTPTQCRHSGSNGVMKSITEVYTHTVQTFRVKWSDEVYHWGVHPHSADIQGQMEWWSLSHFNTVSCIWFCFRQLS